MTRLLIYVFPALMDMALSLSLTVCSVRLAKEMELSALKVAGVMSAWGIAYMVFCPWVGRKVNRRNASRMLVLSCLAGAILLVGFSMINNVAAMYVNMALVGVVCAFFFTPFQIFMAAVDEGGAKPITYSTGMYTFSWSMGFAAGPLVMAVFSSLEKPLALTDPGAALSALRWTGEFLFGAQGATWWQFSYLFAALVLVGNAIGIASLARHAHEHEHDHAEKAEGPTVSGPDYSRQPNYALLACLGAGVGIFAIQMVRGVFPSFSNGDVLGLPKRDQGMVLFVLSVVQAFVGLGLCWSRKWMYRIAPVVGVGLFGIAGLLCLGLGRTMPVFLTGAACYGVYSGCFFFYFVFHAIAHPDKASKQVGFNESMVGVMGIVAPFLGGLTADHVGMSAPFVICAVLVVLALGFQAWVHRRGFVTVEAVRATGD